MPSVNRIGVRRKEPAWALLALLIATAGCSGPDREAPAVRNWLFEGTPGELVDLSDQTRREVVSVASFRPGGALAPGWRIEGGRTTANGRCLAPEAGSIELRGPATAAMVGAERIEIEVQGLMLMPIVLAWGGPIESAPDAARRFWADAQGPSRSRISYEVGVLAPERRGGDDVRLRLVAEADREVCLESLSAVVVGRDDARLAQLAESPLRVDLDGEVRSARLPPPGGAIEIPVPRQAVKALRVGFGRVGKSASAFVYRVVLLADGDRRELLSERWESAAPDGWRDREIAVAGLPRAARLRLEAAAEGDPGLAVAVWSDAIGVTGAPSRPRTNVVLISIDTLRADRLSSYGAERPTSPGLDAWARRRAVLFENAIVQAPWTLPSHASMLSGLDAFHHSAIYAKPVPAGVTFVQESLARAGYRTRAVTGAAYLDPRYGFSRGFERYRHWRGTETGSEIEHGIEGAFRYLDELADEPFFLFFHTYEVHGPYRAHEPYFSRFSALRADQFVVASPTGEEAPGRRERQHIMVMFPPGRRELQVPLPPELSGLPLDLYDSGVASADAQITRLLARLEEKGLADKTLVIVTSDHGEALGEHEVGGHGFLYDDNLKVPLMVALPGGREGGRRVPDQVRSIDIVPTILELAGLPPASGLDGRSLMAIVEGRGEKGVREAWSYSGALGVSLRLSRRAKFFFWDGVVPARSERDRFFELERDPAELHDTLASLRARAGLQDRVLARLRAQSGGLRIGLSAPAGAAMAVLLEAPWLGTEITKWSANPIDAAHWRAANRLEIPLPAGAATELLVRLQAPPSESLAVVVTGADGVAARGAVDLAAAAGPARKLLGFRAGGELRFAESLPPDADPRPLLAIEWSGALRMEAADPAQEDAALREQLQALGYLN